MCATVGREKLKRRGGRGEELNPRDPGTRPSGLSVCVCVPYVPEPRGSLKTKMKLAPCWMSTPEVRKAPRRTITFLEARSLK